MSEHWNGGNGGKGSAPRPYAVDQDTFASNWDAIFSKEPKLRETEKQVILSTEQTTNDDT